jgi:hypothetical protein
MAMIFLPPDMPACLTHFGLPLKASLTHYRYLLGMAYLGDAIDAHLAAATGDDAALFRELRAAFVESARRQVDLLGRARCDGNWQMAAQRLKSLAATFHAADLIALADEALCGAPGDPTVLRRLAEAIDSIEPTG